MRILLFIGVYLIIGPHTFAQSQDTLKKSLQPKIERLTLQDAITMAQYQSTDAFVARHQFLAAYWQYRSFRAELLPSLNLGVTLPNFSHALIPLQNSETGEYNYVQDYSMRNSLNLSINQNIAPTGGKVSIYSSLERIDQFEPQRYHLYNSNPVSITYTQPIFGSLNTLKWDKKIEPERYEQAKFEYLEAMEEITVKAVNMFFALVQANQSLETAKSNYANSEKLYKIAQERFKIGTINNNDLMQLELRMLNDGMTINQSEVEVKLAGYKLSSFLGYPENFNLELIIPHKVPEMMMNYDDVYSLSLNNTSFKLKNKMQLLEAEMSVAQAKANRGAKADFFAKFGLNQSHEDLSGSYRNTQDQENIQLGIQIPIMDWGMGRGRVKMAQSRMNVIKTQVEQLEVEHQQDVLVQVLQFNNQGQQCRISAKANDVATQRYQLSMEQFSNGTLSVLEFNTSQTEKDQATSRFISELHNYWKYYYTLQKSTLYDFKAKRNISTDFDLLIQK